MSLVGLELTDGWKVVQEITRAPAATGGAFSRSYIAEKDGRRAFMKAIDYMAALQHQDPATMLHHLTQEFLFEKEVLGQCGDKGMRRVVRQLGHGVVNINAAGTRAVVQYLILERADDDLRCSMGSMSLPIKMRALHQIAVGLHQLHQIGVAHQDLKPSNVLLFNELGAKVGDLGCASQKGVSRERDKFHVAGDLGYAPPELLYSSGSNDWRLRRLGCDSYLLGSLVFLMWTQVSLTSAIVARLPAWARPMAWNGQFVDVIPHLQSAFEDAMVSMRKHLTTDYLMQLEGVVRELCDPVPEKRWIVASGSALPMERYIAKLDLVARRCELAAKASV